MITSPHSNMIGLYYLPVPYIAQEVGIPSERCSDTVRTLSEARFCSYDWDSEVVWVREMARWQIGVDLDQKSNQAKGAANQYEAAPDNAYLGEFFEKYADHYHLKTRREPNAVRTVSERCSDVVETGSEYRQGKAQDQAQDQANTTVESSVLVPAPTRNGNLAPRIVRVVAHYNLRLAEHRTSAGRRKPKDRNFKSDSREWRSIRDSIKSGLDVEDLCLAIDGMFRTPHNLGHNDRNQEYLGLHLAVKSENIDRFIGNAEHPPTPPSATKRGRELQAVLQAPLDTFKDV